MRSVTRRVSGSLTWESTLTEDDTPKFVEGSNFSDWFEKNEDLIHEMHRNDSYELLYQAWFAGYSNGLSAMAELTKPLWPKL